MVAATRAIGEEKESGGVGVEAVMVVVEFYKGNGGRLGGRRNEDTVGG